MAANFFFGASIHFASGDKPISLSLSFLSSPAASLLPHRFVTVRRGSPAAKSGQIRAGDRLEAVEGRSVVGLPHRELAQILRRAGNTLRLTIVPRPSTCKSTQTHTPHTLRPPASTPRSLPQTRPACLSPRMTQFRGAGRVKGHAQR